MIGVGVERSGDDDEIEIPTDPKELLALTKLMIKDREEEKDKEKLQALIEALEAKIESRVKKGAKKRVKKAGKKGWGTGEYLLKKSI